MAEKILIVDDEKEMRHLLKLCLEQNEYDIDEACSGDEALDKLLYNTYDLVLLDIMMPTVDGFEVLKKIRQDLEEDIPVVLLTALGDTEKVVKGLNLGGDDYIVKPFEPKELVARIASILRRVSNKRIKKECFTIHDLVFYPDHIRVTYQDRVLPLTKKEFHLLLRLANNPGRVFSREQLLVLEWGHHFDGDTRTVDAHIKNIREKLKQVNFQKSVIETVWGIGYKMVEEDSS
ncbi:two component transcriptional regulator, winged helix family [Caldalkalibacillus thermarum TA2.A1]|uniref:Response regulator transcription factor n=1 Tax=Caldalkalibacillus thermarum (strain TA2.A1) TaxID=986075 RepID=F5L3U6_CALTT|nr:response regulator transcription factor [Caldalkalibacillus thermarum]EGL83988.1 two component transcriptional regulator, winged helix family [Caldalkalibacillus thermarum TA2.A1]QZT35049.1 response regulator transcription factor [Caldalkalibacillus thermarum TA2.A1]